MRVGIFCGIANPDHFKELLQREGFHVVAECVSADHVAPDQETLHHFGKQCLKERADLLLCTEKDRVRMGETFACPLPIGWVKMDLSIVEGHSHWNAFLKGIKTKLDRAQLISF
jgi:tetraacyldisaccharide 4'-kinase